MLARARWLKRLLLDLPRNTKVAYCLAFDPRVPARNKAALAASLTLIASPVVDIPDWIPVLGELDALALSILATQVFVRTAPADVVAEQEELIRQRRSRFDEDVEKGRRMALRLARRLGIGATADVTEYDYVGVAIEPSNTTSAHPFGVQQ
jgi:uncharacterized membrane protein YkvA (DUF1232 family)